MRHNNDKFVRLTIVGVNVQSGGYPAYLVTVDDYGNLSSMDFEDISYEKAMLLIKMSEDELELVRKHVENHREFFSGGCLAGKF